MAATKQAPQGDTTRTERAKAHLERLAEAQGNFARKSAWMLGLGLRL